MHLRHVWILFLLAPMISAQEPGLNNPFEPTPTTMYMHLNGFQDAPINTQKPDDRYYAADDVGLAQHSQGCVESPGGTILADTHHSQYGYSSPGYVQYDIDQGGEPRYHPERGISFDVELDPTAGATFTWYMESQFITGDNDPNVNTIPALLPSVVMRTTIREGDQISVNHEALNEGAIIAQGQTAPANLAGPLTPDHPQVTYIPFQGRHLYEFKLDMDVQQSTIRADESFNVRVDIYMDTGTCNDPSTGEYLMLDWVRTHTSADYRPTIDWTVMNPLRIDYLHPQFVGDDLVVHVGVNSPWGNYDVYGDSYDGSAEPILKITGPSRPIDVQLAVFGVDHTQHDHHTEAVAVTWVWPYMAENALDGLYTVTAEFRNDQETTVASGVAQFEIGSGRVIGCGYDGIDGCVTPPDVKPQGDQKSPGVGMILLPALGALAFLRRKA